MSRDIFISKYTVFSYSKNQLPKPVKPYREDERTPKDWVSWGDNDTFPNDTRDKIEQSDVASSLMATRKDLHYGNGLIYYAEEITDKGKFVKVPLSIPEIDDFIDENELNLQYAETLIRDYEMWNVGMSEIVIDSKVNQKISRVFMHDASHTRLAKRNSRGLIPKVFLSANFPRPRNEELKTLPMIDPYNPIDYIKEASGYRFMFPTISLSSGKSYYPKPNWYSVVSSGWLDIALSVPTMKKALFENMMSLKYLVEINETHYWPSRYPKWGNFTEEERNTKRKALQSTISSYLAGEANVGKALNSAFFVDTRTGKEVSGIKITPLKDNFPEGKFLPDSSAANLEILYGFRVNPAIYGIKVAEGNISPGGGSEQREAMKILQQQMTPYRQKSLSLMRFISKYNKWNERNSTLLKGKRIKWSYRDIDSSTTLDENPTGSQEIVN